VIFKLGGMTGIKLKPNYVTE